MKLKVSKESASGLNTEFVNVETGRRIPLEQAVAQISKGNKNYENYQVVNKSDGTTYIRSKADGIKKNNIELEDENLEKLGRGNLIDLLYKKVSRPKIINPTFLTSHPIDLSPLARANDGNSNLTDRFQLIVNGQEIINGYSELVDSAEQEQRLIEQSKLKAQGDEEAMTVDYEYIRAMEYGMPPISGWGLGIDRFLQFLTNCDNIRDVVLYPLMRPRATEEEE